MNKFKHIILLALRKVTSDELYIRIRYFFVYGRILRLKNPDTFFAKINWLKLFDRDPIYTNLVDKYEVRKYVKKKVGEKYLVENFGVYYSPDEINFKSLPEKFILKATHGAAWNIICENKAEFNIEESKRTLYKWLNSNFYDMWGEHAYKDVPPRIVCEELLSNEGEPCLIDYKFHCFHGTPRYIQIDRNRFQNHTLDFYDLDWNHLPFELWFPLSKNDIPRPAPLKEMITVAEFLSKEFRYVRVDLYAVEDKVYFGELTFYPCNGFGVFTPEEMDYEFGRLLNLNLPQNQLA